MSPPSSSVDVKPTFSFSLLGGVWTITSIATISVCARFYVRWRRFSRLQWDDFFVALAWACSIPLAVQPTVANKARQTDETDNGRLFTSRPVVQFFFYTCVYSIKISFLIFFKKIGTTHLRKLKLYWRCVLGFTILIYLVLWAFNPYSCWIKKGVIRCERDASTQKILPIQFGVATALDVLTDCLIAAIPFAVLANVQLRLKQRIVLYSMFLLVIITMSAAIARAVISIRGFQSKENLNITLLLFLTHVEANTAIIVACIGSFRTLFTQADTSNTPRYIRRSWVPSPMRNRPRSTDSTDAMVSTDLHYLTPTSSKQNTTYKEQPVLPEAHIRDHAPNATPLLTPETAAYR